MKLTNIALNNLRRRKMKMLFLVLGLIFGVATVVTLLSITEAMQFNLKEQLKGSGAKIIIKPKSDTLSFSYGPIVIASGVAYDIKELTQQTLEEIAGLGEEQINSIAPKLLHSTQVQNKQILVVGIDFEQELSLKPYWSVSGALPQSDSQVLIGAKVAQTLNLSPGAAIDIEGQEYRVSGILAETAGEEDGLIFMDLAELQGLTQKPGALTFIEVSAAGGEENATTVDHVAANLRDRLPEATVTPVKEAVEARKQLVDQFANFSWIITIIVIAIGTLIILSSMMSSVNERTREIGIFRAIGFRKTHILKIILLEAGIISFLGSIGGYLVGMILAVYAAPLVTELQLNITWNPWLMVMIISSAVVVGLASGIYPAVKASRLDPAEALRFI